MIAGKEEGNMKEILHSSGLKFNPDEEELVGTYLHKRKIGSLTPMEKALVPDFDFYGKREPWEIWELFEGRTPIECDDLFFFTKLKKKTSNGHGQNINRLVGVSGGTWHGVDCETTIKVRLVGVQDWVVGLRKRFSYKNPNSDQNGRWIMHEYTLRESKDDVALCRLRKKRSKDEADILEKGPTKKKRNSEFEKTADTSNNALHEKRKLNEKETFTPNQEARENVQGNQTMGLTFTDDEGATIAATALADGISVAESNGQENIGAATGDDGFSWEGMVECSFGVEDLLAYPEDMPEMMNFGTTRSLERTGLESPLLGGTATLSQLPSTIASDETDKDTNFQPH